MGFIKAFIFFALFVLVTAMILIPNLLHSVAR